VRIAVVGGNAELRRETTFAVRLPRQQ
jgi:hypothetical protein